MADDDQKMEISIKLAGIPIQIHSLYDSLIDIKEYGTGESPVFSVTITENDIVNERQKSMAECVYEGLDYPDYAPKVLERTAIYRKIAMMLPVYDGVVFHGSAVAVDHKAYLFTAKSGTGKTTHTNLWLKTIPGSFIVNGDKPVLRIIDDIPMVCGTPWMGKERLGCNRQVPLAGICFLERGKENRIREVSFREVIPRLIGQCYRPPSAEMLNASMRVLDRIGQMTPFYQLSCNMEEEAALIAYKGMCQGLMI